MGSPHMSVTGGALGTSAAAPGTNSLGTALSSSGTGRPMKGPLLGTNPAIDREEAKVDKMIGSICRGCSSRRPASPSNYRNGEAFGALSGGAYARFTLVFSIDGAL